MVAGDIEIALDLGGVQVHGQDPVHTRLGQQVGHQLGGDGLAPSRLAVGPGIAVVGDHRRDLPGRGSFAGIHHHQQLHQVIVHRSAGGLDQEDVTAPDRFLDLDVELAVRKAFDHPRAIRDPQVGADFAGQGLVRGAAEQAQALGVVAHACLIDPFCGQETGHGAAGCTVELRS